MSFDELLHLEDRYYREGYDAGQADGTHAGLVEGALFGVDKGFEKAVRMGRLSGRAAVWQRRFQSTKPPPPSSSPPVVPGHGGSNENKAVVAEEDAAAAAAGAGVAVDQLPWLSASTNPRLAKHLGALSATTDAASLSGANTDAAVAEFDERLAKAVAKARLIANVVAEPVQVDDADAGAAAGATSHGHRGIEESGSLAARR